MAFRTIGFRTVVLSTAFAIKSTGKPARVSTAAGEPQWFALGAAYSKFGLRVSLASTVATSSFSIKLMGSLSTIFSAVQGASQFATLLTATSASIGGIKQSTGNIPATWVFIRSTKFSTAAGRKVRIELCGVP